MLKQNITRWVAAVALGLSGYANATIVQFQTSLGDFEVNLYDQAVPATVANFLNYVDSGAYDDSIIHRSVAGFIVQGGGFAFPGELPLEAIASGTAVVNEPVYSNVRATIAMAKQAGDPNSATNQWFFNLSDNSANLDTQNGGFTVFGEVMLDGMDIVDAIADVPVFSAGQLTSLPLQDFDPDAEVDPDDTNFIMVYAVVVLDSAQDTAAELEPAPNTLLKQSKKSKKGGAVDWLLVVGIILIILGTKFRTARKNA